MADNSQENGLTFDDFIAGIERIRAPDDSNHRPIMRLESSSMTTTKARDIKPTQTAATFKLIENSNTEDPPATF